MGKIFLHNKGEKRDKTMLDLIKNNSKIQILAYKELSCLKGGEEEESDIEVNQ
jgi:hypothetical protein